MVAGTTFTVTLALPVAPSRSVTVAVSVCVPAESEGHTTVGPVPSAPSRLEVHRMLAPRSPFSGSRAVAPSTTGLPARRVVPAAGARVATTGGTVGARTTIG